MYLEKDVVCVTVILFTSKLVACTCDMESLPVECH